MFIKELENLRTIPISFSKFGKVQVIELDTKRV